MRTVVISTQTRELIEAHTSNGRMQAGAVWVGGPAWQIEIEEEVYGRLMLLDPDINVAIRKACLNQYGHA